VPGRVHTTSPRELQARLRAERRGTPFLHYRDESGAQVLVELGDAEPALTLGRRPDNEIALTWDAEVSRVHAQLERVGGEWTLVDDGLSRNGSYVNGERIVRRRRLRDGDRVCVGETEIVYRAPDEAGSDSTASVEAGMEVAVTPAQHAVLVALCRPVSRSAYSAPATNRDIAAELFLSVDAVKAHLRSLYTRFGLDDLPQNQKRARLAALALVNGLVRAHHL
jgi:pSer/pThr/pTyr-binding forkhead associated (FHA) protein